MGFCLMPCDPADGMHVDIKGDDYVVKTSGSISYDIVGYDSAFDSTHSYDYTAALYDAAGKSQSSAVSPSSGTMSNGSYTTLSITAPSTAGTYTLKVTVTDGDDSKVKEVRESIIRVVAPITLSATLENTSSIALKNLVVYFMVDGKKLDDSNQQVSVDAFGTSDIKYEYVTYGLSSGAHSYAIVTDSETVIDIVGLDVQNKFYVGQESYSGVTAILGVLAVILFIILLYIYRKPVKNYGKPKARR